MAKQQYGLWDALEAAMDATKKSQNGDLSQNQKLEVTKKAMAVIENSNFKTLAMNMDRAIELRNQIEEQLAGQANQVQVENVEAERIGLPAMPILEFEPDETEF